MKAFLILEDGTVFEGTHIGADKEVISEIVFNTSMAGYLEVLTDPSYAGQAVCMTYPLIGNYGICKDDMESRKPWPDGFIVRELSRNYSNFRADISIQQFLEENGVPGIAGIDTRALTKILREKGTMNGMITTNENYNFDEILPRLKAYTTGKVVEKVTCDHVYEVKGSQSLTENGAISGSAKFDAAAFAQGVREKKPSLVKELNGKGKKVALLDLGTKANIAYSLKSRGCDVTVYPAQTKAEEIIAAAPDGIMLSNAEHKEDIAIGIIPNGIGNDFARYWDIGMDYKQAVDWIIKNRHRKIDVGFCNFYDGEKHQRRYFLNAINIGFGARIVKVTDGTKRFWGVKFLSYLAAFFLLFFERNLYRMHLRINDEHIRGRIMTVCVGSACGYGQTPSAVPYNGWLDVSVIYRPQLLQTMSGLWMLIQGRILNHKVVKSYRTKKVKVLRAKNAAVDLDGRILPKHFPLEIGILPEKITLIIPD